MGSNEAPLNDGSLLIGVRYTKGVAQLSSSWQRQVWDVVWCVVPGFPNRSYSDRLLFYVMSNWPSKRKLVGHTTRASGLEKISSFLFLFFCNGFSGFNVYRVAFWGECVEEELFLVFVFVFVFGFGFGRGAGREIGDPSYLERWGLDSIQASKTYCNKQQQDITTIMRIVWFIQKEDLWWIVYPINSI